MSNHSEHDLTLMHANNKGPDQPAHPHSLISAFVIPYLESVVLKLAPCNISLFWLVALADQTYLLGNIEDRFS